MLKLFIAFLIGLVLGGLLVGAGAYAALNDKEECGRHLGSVAAHSEIVGILEREFGNADSVDQGTCLFSHKTSAVISIVENGVKTVRVVP